MDRYAVMGNPVQHSKSPDIHAAFAKQTGQSLSYDRILVEPGTFIDSVDTFRTTGGKGLNVTVPYKQEAFALATVLTGEAQVAQAVNTLWFENETLHGANTDGMGLVRDMTINHHRGLADQRILILGAGGAVSGILSPILAKQPKSLVVVNRTVSRATELAQRFDGAVVGCGYDALEGQSFDLVINGTSASLAGELPPLPTGLLADNAWCYDLMYAAQPTPFMVWAMEQGAEGAVDGLGMLVEQAAESFTLWRGIRPETGAVIEALRG